MTTGWGSDYEEMREGLPPPGRLSVRVAQARIALQVWRAGEPGRRDSRGEMVARALEALLAEVDRDE